MRVDLGKGEPNGWGLSNETYNQLLEEREKARERNGDVIAACQCGIVLVIQ